MINPPAPRILYVEDNADTRDLVTVLLGSHNCLIVSVGDAAKALEQARKQQFDLYILDNWLPDCSGIDLCQKLRKFDTKTPVLFCSGAAYERDRDAAKASGAQGYLTKPLDISELVAEVFRLTGTDGRGETSA